MINSFISIIIPCYNQGTYLKEALASLELCNKNLFEVIIINDGSTDDYTNSFLNNLENSGYNVISQENQGLGAARNAGIKNATGDYILPLDADNKIYPAYITKAIEIMNNNDDIAVVYGNAQYFGDREGVLKPKAFNLQRLMLGNYIDACAVIRKSSLEAVGYYDNMKIMGYEDWDLWLRMAFGGYKFFYIDEVLFEYRVSKNSMMRTLNADIKKQNEIERYLMKKFSDKLDLEFVRDYFIYKFKKKPFRFMYRLGLRKFFPNYYLKLVRTNKIYNGLIHDRI